MKIYRPLLIFLILVTSYLHAEVDLSLSRNKISVEDTVDLILSYRDNGFPRPPALTLPDGLRELGTSNQRVSINGKTEYSVRYTLKASSPGSYTIGPYKLRTSDGVEELPALTLTVTKATILTTDDDLFVTLESSSPTALVRETIDLTLSFYTRVNVGRINLEDSPQVGFEQTQWQEFQSGTRTVNGRSYRVNKFQARLTPTRAGTITLDPLFKVEVIGSYSMPRGRSRSIMNLKLPEPFKITVKAPPTEGQPEDYSGHLGNFRLNASVSPREVNVGDPITLRVELSGSGSLQQALPPGMSENDNFKVYKPRLISEDMQRDGLSGRKIIEQVVIPKHDNISEIPALEFSYFDTEAREYRTLSTKPFTITVHGDKESQGPATISSLTLSQGHEETVLLGDDLLYLKTHPGKIQTTQALQIGWPLAAWSGLPFAIWAFSGLVLHKKDKSDKDPHAQRRQQAPRRLRKHLAKLDASDDDVYKQIWEILSEYLSGRLSLPPGELNPSDVVEQLPSTLSEETQTKLMTWMQRCDRARFAGETSSQEQNEIRKDFRSFMLTLDRELGR